MTPSIKLNDQLFLMTNKINYIRPNNNLALKFEFCKTFRTQLLPEDMLRINRGCGKKRLLLGGNQEKQHERQKQR